MQLDENRMRDLVIDHEEKRILNEIKWELKQFYYPLNCRAGKFACIIKKNIGLKLIKIK